MTRPKQTADALPAHRPGQGYTDAEKERGLTTLALHSGNTRRTASALKDQGLPIPRTTLQMWAKQTESDLYQRVAREVLPVVKADLAEKHTEIADRQIEVARKLTDRIDREADTLSIRDVSTAQRNLDVGSGIHTQRGAELRGDPTVIVREHRDIADILRTIQTKFPSILSREANRLLIDSTAEEVPESD